MNGRMYDPAVGRFLSADIVIQDPGNTQSYNRYSYCLNNPLKYIDPSGYTLVEQMSPQDLEEMKSTGRGWETSFNNGNLFIDGSGSGSGWYNANRQALNKGYTGGFEKSMDNFDKQLYSPNYNGTISYHYFLNYHFVDQKGVPTALSVKHQVTRVNMSGFTDVFSNTLYMADLINTLYDENASRNLKALEKEAAALKRITHSLNKSLDANKFTKVITKSIGKKLFYGGLIIGAIDLAQNPSGSNLAWYVADGLVGVAAFVPGLQLPAAIYFTGRIAYDIIEEY